MEQIFEHKFRVFWNSIRKHNLKLKIMIKNGTVNYTLQNYSLSKEEWIFVRKTQLILQYICICTITKFK